MHAVVNQLHFRDPVPSGLFGEMEGPLAERMHAIEGFEALHVVQPTDTEVVLIILGDSAETLDRVATEVGSPWIIEHVAPLLGGPPERQLGPVIASTGTT